MTYLPEDGRAGAETVIGGSDPRCRGIAIVDIVFTDLRGNVQMSRASGQGDAFVEVWNVGGTSARSSHAVIFRDSTTDTGCCPEYGLRSK